MRKTIRYFLGLLAMITILSMIVFFKRTHLSYKKTFKNYIRVEAVRRDMNTVHFDSKKNLSALERAIEEAISISVKINRRKPPVLMTLVNNAYLPFAYSWLCNTKSMDIHSQVLFFVTDSKSLKLKNDWPEVNVVLLPGATSIQKRQCFGFAGYVKLMIMRTDIIHRLLLRDVNLLLFEVDCLWVSNPIPECQSKLKDYDVLGTRVNKNTNALAGGFLYFRTTNRMKLFWGFLNRLMKILGEKISEKRNYVYEYRNEQSYMKRMVKQRFFNIRIFYLPWHKYPDGLWYKMSVMDRNATDPVLINNNWIAGNEHKIARAIKWGHWFIDNKMKCNETLINKIVKKQNQNK